jgi:hypothetical protein
MASLVDLIAVVGQLDPDGLIVVSQPWGSQSDATCIVGGEDAAVPSGFAYFLEVDLLLDVAEVWSRWLDGRVPTPDELTRAAIHYATYDAYLEGDSDR